MKYLRNKAKGFTLVELMVVIVIVGILAAVAIPKFLDASHKAKASEFPTVLTSIYTAEQAQQAETGLYASSMTSLTTAAVVDIPSSEWFSYSIDQNTGDWSKDFYGTATATVSFGKVAKDGTARIDQAGTKTATDNGLKTYCPNWK